MEEYKREKRRAIPSWSQSLAYSKFKADLFSWDQEHHLSAGSVKFGILAEILKSQGRISTYEQIQARLGKTRNEANIINQIVALLGVDGAHKRDILAKVDFNKEPKQVYEDTKTAIRDICGEKSEDDIKTETDPDSEKVLLVKPWQEKQFERNQGGERFSKSKSGDRNRGDRFRDRSRSYSRDRTRGRERSRDRSDSQGRTRRRSSVSFQERRRRDRRETTPGPGTHTVIAVVSTP